MGIAPAAGRHRLRRPAPLASLPIFLLLTVMGCGPGDDGLDRQAVSGKITLDGQPLAQGVIRFQPESSDATTEVSAPITDGSYSFTSSTGPVPGTYKIGISSAQDPQFVIPEGQSPGEFRPPPAKETVPDKYNVKTELTATVKAGQTEAIDFALTSK